MQKLFSKNSNKRKLIGSILLAVLLAGCVVPDGPHRPPLPPPHLFYYWYYPYAGAYYDINRQVYFYVVNGVWIQAIVLPPYLRPKLTHRVKIQTKLPKPYEMYREHVKKYPAPRIIDRTTPPKKVRKPVIRDGRKYPAPKEEQAPDKDKRKKKDEDKRGRSRR